MGFLACEPRLALADASSTSAQQQLELWAAAIFPFEFGERERICVQRYWKADWPSAAPDKRQTWKAEKLTDRVSFCDRLLYRYAGYNVGVCFATTDDSPFRNKKAFFRGQALGVDLDVGNGKKKFATVHAAQLKVREFEETTGILAGLTVASGTGIQAYFLLDTPCSDGDRFERALKGIIGALAGDPAASDRLRILRPPGTLNYKYAPPKPVTLLSCRGVRYSLEKVEASTPHIRSAFDKSKKGLPSAGPIPPGKAIRPVPYSVRTLLEGDMPSRYGGNKSDRDFFVACKLLEEGHAIEDVIATMLSSKLGQQAFARKPKPVDYIRRTVENAAPKQPMADTSSSTERLRQRATKSVGIRPRKHGTP